MKNFKYCFLAFIMTLLFTVPLFGADYWYVCVASCSDKKNANEYTQLLEKNGYKARIVEFEKDAVIYYRVLVDSPYDFNEEARAYCNQLKKESFFTKNNLTGLWIVRAAEKVEELAAPEEPVVTEVPEIPEVIVVEEAPVVKADFSAKIDLHLDETPVILESNKEAEIHVSEEKPYSVKVRSYKEETAANNDKTRLQQQDIDAYILKIFDETEYFTFDLHAGAFETQEEAEELQEKLEDYGIEDTELSDYEDIKDQIKKYDEVVSAQSIVYEAGNVQLEEFFEESVIKCINQFPVNPDFDLQTIYIYDYDNIREYGTRLVDKEGLIDDDALDYDLIHAASYAVYKDNLFDKKIAVHIIEGDKGFFNITLNQIVENTEGTKTKFAVKDGTMDCVIYENDYGYALTGLSPQEDLLINLIAYDFTEEELNVFTKNIYNDSSVLVYPQLRKNLLILPEPNPDVRRSFKSFSLSKVDESYAEDRDYSNWSVPIVGHWEADAVYDQEDIPLSIAFFDMDYDYNAKMVHGMFMDAKSSLYISDNNHSPDYDRVESWYLNNLFTEVTELSFSVKSYIVAIDSFDEDRLEEPELLEVCDDLKIWNLYSSEYGVK